MTEISNARTIRQIILRYPEAHRNDGAHRALRQLWGYPEVNDCGVFENWDEITIALKGQKMWHAEINIATAPNGWHAVSTDYQYSIGGGGSAPSIWDRKAYSTRAEALQFGFEELIKRYEGVRDQKYAPESQVRLAEKMIEELRRHGTYLGGDLRMPEPMRPGANEPEPTQLSLF